MLRGLQMAVVGLVRRRATPALFGCLALFASGVVAAGQPVTVRDVRLHATPEATRLVIEVSADTPHRLSTLVDPDRVVIDLDNATLDPRLARLPDGHGVITRLRSAPREGGDLRVVLDLRERVRARASLANPTDAFGFRLIVDLAPVASAGGGTAGAAADRAVPARAAAGATGASPRAAETAADRATDRQPDRSSDRPAAPLPPLRLRDLVVAIDAGHGGVDPGAIGRQGTREKDVTLAIARRLAERVNDEPGMRAVLTRTGDYFVPLRERMRRARAAEADLFLSIHADAVANSAVAGSSVFILSPRGASSEAARRMAARENAADLVGGVTLKDKDPVLASVLLDLSQSATMSASQVAAESVLNELNEVVKARRAEVQKAGFVVLKSPDVPSMLIETAFITNPGDEKRLRDPRHQKRIADAVLSGVRAYFRDHPPPGTRAPAAVARVDTARETAAGGGGR
ncbi:MAG: N-acetylmuramoyl-L-alanine amidase [Steroidobacteraceae bacterium]|jgi:N-acetylmuramoyl-L-alanine amidase|nr:N-acetylmuramoyl-L-alanine amidase [Steroidobacteraceae bacterium]